VLLQPETARTDTVELDHLRRTEAVIVRLRWFGMAAWLLLHGRGFDPATPARGHFGLLTMRERAEACGGALAVQTTPGVGTEIAVTVPTT
jgi:signal transduction histidine kinase